MSKIKTAARVRKGGRFMFDSTSGDPTRPHTVLRGLEHQLVHLGLDSLYLVVEYPHADLYHHWLSGVSDLNDPHLYQGIPYEGMVLKRGGQGYKLSVWEGDARLFITDRVNDKLMGGEQAGHGMGAMLQLGPKWLAKYGQPFAPNTLRKNIYIQLRRFGIENPQQYRVRINRLDIALDVLGLDVASFSLDEWLWQWVGYAKPRNFHLARRKSSLTGITIGSRKGNVCLVIYNKINESIQDGDSLFWRSVWRVGAEDDITVTRFEWSFRPYEARFTNMRYLSDYTFEGFLGLLNYATTKWGRLCIPQDDRNHASRWALAPLWIELRAMIDDWSIHHKDIIRPDYHFKPDIKPAYLNSWAGGLAGLLARLGIELDNAGPVDLSQLFIFLHDQGYTFDEIDQKAAKKYAVFSKLVGGEDHE